MLNMNFLETSLTSPKFLYIAWGERGRGKYLFKVNNIDQEHVALAHVFAFSEQKYQKIHQECKACKTVIKTTIAIVIS